MRVSVWLIDACHMHDWVHQHKQIYSKAEREKEWSQFGKRQTTSQSVCAVVTNECEKRNYHGNVPSISLPLLFGNWNILGLGAVWE